MSEFGRDKIALFLACTSFLGGKTSAKDIDGVRSKNPQTVAAVGGRQLHQKICLLKKV